MSGCAYAQAFTDHYYPTFDQNRQALAGLYSDQSVLCFEGQKVQGTQAIVSKLTSLPFQRCQHKVTSLDSHAVPSGGVLVFVTGQLLVRDYLYQADCVFVQLLFAHEVRHDTSGMCLADRRRVQAHAFQRGFPSCKCQW